MDQQTRRNELAAQYKQSRPEAGVYRFVNGQTIEVADKYRG